MTVLVCFIFLYQEPVQKLVSLKETKENPYPLFQKEKTVYNAVKISKK